MMTQWPSLKMKEAAFSFYWQVSQCWSQRHIWYPIFQYWHCDKSAAWKTTKCVELYPFSIQLLYEVVGGICWFHSVRPSVRPSVCPSVRLSRMPCPLCNIYSSGRILSILGTNDHYHKRVCRVPWLLTLTYIFKVIQPSLRKSCPLCSIYSSEWILFIFETNDHYH